MVRHLPALLVAAFIAFGAGGAHAQGLFGNDSLGFCSLTPSTSTQMSSCTGGVPFGTTWALVCAYTQNINYRDDPTNTAPTGTVGTGGQQVASGQCIVYNGNFQRFRMIQQAASAVVGITFYAGVN